ncbi:hypothetical protein KY289_023980 [Solanum tuberosum]|nr:hypothetical protein KY289_023980 [Solanum tuberosum]
MAEMREDWMSGQAPPSSIRDYLNTSSIYPPGFGPYANTSNVTGTSTMRPLSTPMMSNPLFMPTAPTNSIPQPTMVSKSNNDPPSQSIRGMQGLGGHKGISFSDLCMFPHVHLPAGIKTPKFEKYDGHGDPMAHLKRYCNQLSDRSLLSNTRKKTTENFREYAVRWREKAARVKPPMKELEMIDVFLQAQEPNYFDYLLSAVGKTFAEVIKVGEMVENGIKSGKIVSQAALKATTQVLQNGTGNIGGKKRREDVATVVSAPQTYVQDNPPQHYFHSQTLQYPVPYSPYPFLAPNQLSLLLIRKGVHQFLKIIHHPHKFTKIPPKFLHVLDHNTGKEMELRMSYSQHYAYCSDAQGHNIERFWYLKREIQDLIDTHRIIVESPTGPNINQNPLPRHTETNMLEMMNGCEEIAVPYKPILKVGTGMENSVNVVDLTKIVPSGEEKTLEKLSPSNTLYKDSSVPFVKANNENEALVYQAFEVVVLEHILEGNLISKPQLPMASVMMVNEMLKHGFKPGYEPRVEDKMKVKKQKRDVWSLTKPISPIYKSSIKARTTESSESPFPEPVLEVNE